MGEMMSLETEAKHLIICVNRQEKLRQQLRNKRRGREMKR